MTSISSTQANNQTKALRQHLSVNICLIIFQVPNKHEILLCRKASPLPLHQKNQKCTGVSSTFETERLIVFHGHIGQKSKYAGNNNHISRNSHVFVDIDLSFRYDVHVIGHQGSLFVYECALDSRLRQCEESSLAFLGNSIVIKVLTTSITKTSNLRDLTSIFSKIESCMIVNNGILQTCGLNIDMVSRTVVCIIPIPQKRLTCSKLGRYGVAPWGGNKCI